MLYSKPMNDVKFDFGQPMTPSDEYSNRICEVKYSHKNVMIPNFFKTLYLQCMRRITTAPIFRQEILCSLCQTRVQRKLKSATNNLSV